MIYQEKGQGTQKMQYVMEVVWNYLPKKIKIIIPKALFKKMIENWFCMIKELLHYHVMQDIEISSEKTE